MSSTRIEQLIGDAQAAFDRRPTDIEAGLDIDDAALLQLRKGWRMLAGAEALRDATYYPACFPTEQGWKTRKTDERNT